jgi:hypothetical protein
MQAMTPRGSIGVPRVVTLLFFVLPLLLDSSPGRASELSHYAGGLANADDFFLPPPEAGQFLYAQYNFYYTTDTFRDGDGKKIETITIVGRAAGQLPST